MRHRSRAHAALIVTLLAVAAGCGSSDSGDSSADDLAAPSTTQSAGDEPASDSGAGSAPTTEPVAEPATEPATEPVAEPATEPAKEPATGEQADDQAENGVPAAAAPGVIDVSLTAAERSAADDPVAQAIIAAFPPGFAPPSEEQANCVGGKIVNELGTDRLAELGVTAESIDIFGATDFTTGEVDAMVDILFDCVDVEFMVASMFAPSAGPDTAECFADFVDEQLIRDLAAPFLGGGAIDAEFFLEQVQAANAACLPDDG